ncbi:cell division control protein 48 CDC48 [Virgisporangium aliadipatigenens]|uniref:Cell division control protein 48 CDC48 n=1 Tax=Virgisporangium aliadipatigenens TaxID=741659 RepID=A0A8J3YK41_9ACTN|nr:cell division control protein 48 CDC48 [Virgisporangium aliadipatigenens]
MIASLSAAVEARPDDVPLRLHLAGLLLEAGRQAEAVGHVAQALQREPGSADAQEAMRRALGAPTAQAAAHPAPPETGASPAGPPHAARRGDETDHRERGVDGPGRGEPGLDGPPGNPADDLSAYEREFADVVPPRFARADQEADPVVGDADRIFDVERTAVRLADVGGMTDVKRRLEMAFLGPLRNPQLRKLYNKSLRGGLLLYGPPGCGKTFLARAVAGEMGAAFVSLAIVDVLEMWIGNSERNLHQLFESARRNAPCVLFLDEIDALGHKRSSMQSSVMRTLGNQLLAELDGMDGDNDGVFVLAATNAPWDVDPALRRPGRLDRTVFVAPPDAEARAAILEYHLRDRPIASIRLEPLVRSTADFSGADLAHLCDSAAEYALADSMSRGEVRMIEQRDFEAALREIKPSIAGWLGTARNVALYANEGGAYDELAGYLKKRKLL